MSHGCIGVLCTICNSGLPVRRRLKWDNHPEIGEETVVDGMTEQKFFESYSWERACKLAGMESYRPRTVEVTQTMKNVYYVDVGDVDPARVKELMEELRQKLEDSKKPASVGYKTPVFMEPPSFIYAPYVPLQITQFTNLDAERELTAAIAEQLDDLYPHVCPNCSSPAYIGLTYVECSRECGAHSV